MTIINFLTKRQLLMVFFFISVQYSHCQTNVDSLFEQARQIAYEGNYAEARQVLELLWKNHPGYADIGIFIARLNYWDVKYDQALLQAREIKTKFPDNREVRILELDILLASKKERELIEAIGEIAKKFPLYNAEAMTYLPRLYLALGDPLRAWRAAKHIKPADENISDSMVAITRGVFDYKLIGLQENYTGLRNGFNRFDHQVEGQRRAVWGAVVGRVINARRSDIDGSGNLAEVEFYPVINKNWYLYSGIGGSWGEGVFPLIRGGLEGFYISNTNWEMSLGGRILHFTDNTIPMATASMGKYFRNNYISARVFYGVENHNAALDVLGRIFFSDPFDFIEVRAGMGFSPENRIIDDRLQELVLETSLRGGVVWQKWLSDHFLLRTGMSYENVRQTAEMQSNFWIVQLGLHYRIINRKSDRK
jgi:YaiO family outer membrane protein